ncbi:MAG: ABC transporter ATP-binding protein [Methanoregula sp.]|jgi:putative ABC transport system ATP-binding protein|uniref:ABC transporter ATP-binding protein n=1 Tax=Methanoregula sp. TaxID=2052170 RepID=UPI0025F885C3|nr:ABC transporter ATP-binding protein [Methanoregula sp.]MCK9632414.1 ABC transporter ATP-binding protein [Methanoregula sp.]
MPATIEVDRLSKVYRGGVPALAEASFTIEKGEFVTLIGRSGSGKSTLLNILGCLDTPTSGSLVLDGVPVNFRDPSQLVSIRRQKIGFVFQQFNLLPHLTAQENVEYPMLFNYHEPKIRAHTAGELLTSLGLGDRKHHHPAELSGGEQQRVAIARALVSNPPIIFADEPTGNLDQKTSADIFSLMQEISRVRKTTFFMVTHEREFGEYADRSFRLIDGKVTGT